MIGPTLHEGCAPRLDQLEAYAQGKDALRWPASAEVPTTQLQSSNPLPPKLLLVGGQLTPLLLPEDGAPSRRAESDVVGMENRMAPPPPIAQVTSKPIYPNTREIE